MNNRFLSLWCRYDTLGASSRLRFLQFIPALENAGFTVDHHTFFSNSYLERLYSDNHRSKTAFLAALLKRFRELRALDKKVPMVIEYELLPFMPFLAEKCFLSGRQYILNFDDAVDLRYEKIPLLRRKYPQLIANAAGVIVANDELLNRFSNYNSNVCKLPTVPPETPAGSIPVKPDNLLRIGWIGTPVTYGFLMKHADVLQKMYALCPFELLAIARAELPAIPGIPTVNVDWSQDTEHHLLQSCHVGIMPLDDTPFAKGKSAFKLIQYLRANIPAIASGVGENLRVIVEGKTGFCASTPEEWVGAWRQLADIQIRNRMLPDIIVNAEKYSFGRNAGDLIDFITSTLDAKYE